MASRRCLQLRPLTTFLFSNPSSLRSLFVPPFPNSNSSSPLLPFFTISNPTSAFPQCPQLRYFSSDNHQDHSEEEYDDDDDDDDDDVDDEDDDHIHVSSGKKAYTKEEMEAEAAAIGYKVAGPLLKDDDRVFKPYEPVFAVVQIGSHQFKVSNGDSIFTERLKFCEVNDKLILNKVLLLGSASQTIVGRPIVPDATVHAVVEEHALDAKVIIFKKKRRKNYRRTKGHRQELTKLRVTDIQGIEKPDNVLPEKPSLKTAKKEQKKAAVTA
ncbi:50S ribosomal protein L21, mitochondrial [Abrus precatorius]|uniref:Large ribosomal subunit protein bL21m n=1 Tax=Abrus precatorius TaxID=3816 RepID=A0A8B8KVZ0_ABRPR|nr:50S ribosomal protein L21, mitochondrial [Abrus precatorius]